MVPWLVPAWAFWALLTPGYNRFLLASGQNLLHLTEYPSATLLAPQGPHDARTILTPLLLVIAAVAYRWWIIPRRP